MTSSFPPAENAPTADVTPDRPEDLAAAVHLRFRNAGPPLVIVGGGTVNPVAEAAPVPSTRLLTTRLNRVVDYPARDMTITVEGGMRLAELQALLATEGQRLPLDIPQAAQATLGGAIAENVSGLGRYANGTFRDYVIGIRAVDGQGRLFAAGGRVVKNVAGYDLCKLLVGARGTLAVLTEVTLKLRPLPETRRIVWSRFPSWESLEAPLAALLTSQTRPAAIEVLNAPAARSAAAELSLSPTGTILCVGFEGTERETTWQVETLRDELGKHRPAALEALGATETERLWSALTELPTTMPGDLLVQAALRPSQLVAWMQAADAEGWTLAAHAGDGVVLAGKGAVEGGGAAAERGARISGDLIDSWRRLSATGLRWRAWGLPEGWTGRGGASGVSPGGATLARRLRRAFDPCGLLNPHVAAG